MKKKRTILFISGIIFFLLLLFSLYHFIPETIHVEKSIPVEVPPAAVFNKINSISNWKNWFSWLQHDTGMLFTPYGSEEGNGSGFQWQKTKYVPSGNFSITKSFPDDSIHFEWHFEKTGFGTGSFIFRKYSRGTYLIWINHISSSRNLFNRFRLIHFKKQLTETIITSLATLKYLCEYEATHHIDINYSNLPECDYLYIRDECFAPEISDRMNLHFNTIIRLMNKYSIKQNGFPFCIYHNVSDIMAFSVCIPALNPDTIVLSGSSIRIGHLPPEKAVVANYHGPYSSLGHAHLSVQKWIAEGNKKISGDPIEMYLTGPDEISDSSRWFTKIFYPVK